LDINRYKYKNIEIREHYKVNFIKGINDLKPSHKLWLKKNCMYKLDFEEIVNRLQSEEYQLLYIFDEKSEEMVAYYWILVSSKEIILHDSFFIEPLKALFCNAYVNKNYRKRGFYTFLINEAYNYCLSNKISNIYTIIESSNVISFYANNKFPIVKYATQYLLKFFSINLLSVNYKFKNKKPTINLLKFYRKGIKTL
jgi:GNAT superfamily N-acetyltransferase